MAPRGGADSRARACRTVFKGDRAPLEILFTGHLETRTPDHSQGPPISLSFLRPHKGKPRVLTRDCQKPHTSDEGAEKLPFYLDDIPGHTEAGSCHLSCFKHPWGTFASQSLPRREILSIWGGRGSLQVACGTSAARDQSRAPCSGSAESQPLDHQEVHRGPFCFT